MFLLKNVFIAILLLAPFSNTFAARMEINQDNFRELLSKRNVMLQYLHEGKGRISESYVKKISETVGVELYAKEVKFLINNEWICGADDYNRMCLIFNHSNSSYLLGSRALYIANSYIKERFPEHANQIKGRFFEFIENERVNISTVEWSNVTPTPLPAGIWLMASGFAALIGISGKFSKLRN